MMMIMMTLIKGTIPDALILCPSHLPSRRCRLFFRCTAVTVAATTGTAVVGSSNDASAFPTKKAVFHMHADPF